MWLECIGVVSGCCCKEVYRFPHITYPYSTCVSSFFAAASLLLCSLLKSSPETSTCEVLSEILQKLQADFVHDNGFMEISLLHV